MHPNSTTIEAAEDAEQAPSHPPISASYSPDDNKLRLYSAARLDRETYERVRAAGFAWAPKQELFVAPMWTPEREDLALELAGEIGDEDTSLVDRAEERAERFDEYSEKRACDAESAHKAVAAIAEAIPLGQPILVGHHSEKHARKNAERIENGMRRAVKMWETSKYWEVRAKGALRHAKYKELPAVRHRRIKGLLSDQRKHQRALDDAERFMKLWRREALTVDQARAIANYDHVSIQSDDPSRPYGKSLWSLLDKGEIAAEAAAEVAINQHIRTVARCERWIAHIDHRLTYERAMLGEQGGIATDRFDLQIGGRVRVSSGRGIDQWVVIVRINRVDGTVASVTTNLRYCRVVGVEMIQDYQPPAEGDAEKVKAATKLPPMTNYPRPGGIEMTNSEWKRTYKDYKGSRVAAATETAGAHRYRTTVRRAELVPVFITDVKRVDPPRASASAKGKPVLEVESVVSTLNRPRKPPPAPTVYDAMKAQLRGGGVQVVAVPQLFPTPAPLVERMLAAAEIESGHRVLEPSAGTGAIVQQLRRYCGIEIVAVEIEARLVDVLRAMNNTAPEFPRMSVRCADFLECTELGTFDRIIMNPPFAGGADIAHIAHAFSMLKPGGRLVAICAGGPRQHDKLRPLVEERGGSWTPLEPDAFRESGTSVRAVLLTMEAARATRQGAA